MILLPVAAPVFLSAAFLVLRGVFLVAILSFPRGWLADTVCRRAGDAHILRRLQISARLNIRLRKPVESLPVPLLPHHVDSAHQPVRSVTPVGLHGALCGGGVTSANRIDNRVMLRSCGRDGIE